MATDLLYIVSTLRRSGPTNQLYYLLENLDDDFNAKILTLSPEPEDSELDRFQELDIEYETLGLSRVKGAVVGPSRLRKKVREYDPDIVHTQGIRADTLSAMFLSAYPRMTTIRNYAYDDYPAKYGRLQGNVMAWTHLRALKRIDHPVACSETIASRMANVGADSKAIQNGVDTEVFKPVNRETKEKIRRDIGLPISKRIIVSVGSLIPRKDPETVIHGFQNSNVTEDSLLVFLGDGPLRKECEGLVENTNSILFEGFVDNVEEYLKASDYFVSAAQSEGLPNSVMEALATGLPVCLSKIQPHEEILQYSEEVGEMFQCNYPDQLSNSLETLLNSEYSHRAETARSIAEHKLSSVSMTNEYQRAYQKISHAE